MNPLPFLIASATVFISYVGFVWIKFGVLPSISDSYYYLKRRPLFFFAMCGTGLPITLQSENGMIFFAGAFICLVGAAGAFHEELTEKVHIVGAVGGIVLGMCSMWIDYGLWWIPVGFGGLTFLLSVFRIKNHTWWIEILAFVGIFTGLILSL